MTFEERYQLGFAEGVRIGTTTTTRKILTNIINSYAKEEGVRPSKTLFQKINREIDLPFLKKMMRLLWREKISIKGLEENYDAIFLTQDEMQNKKFSW